MIKILIVDDQRLILEAVRAVLKDESQIEIVGTARNGQNAIAQVVKLKPDIVLLDIEMPEMNGIVATKHISQHAPNTKVIVLSSHQSDNYITKALQAGASSYLLKSTLIRDLKQAIYSLSQGYSYIETKLLDKTVNQIKASNIFRSRNMYVRRHKKNIYSPSKISSKPYSIYLNASSRKIRNLKRSRASFGINKATIAMTLDESLSFQDELAINYLEPSKSQAIHRVYQKKQVQKLRHKATILFIVIISFILTILIF